MKQYEVWLAGSPAPVGRRPVLLLTRDTGYEFLSNVLIVEITTTVRRIPQELALGPAEGLNRRCVANFDALHVIRKGTLERRIGALRKARVGEVKRALGFALGWPELVLAE